MGDRVDILRHAAATLALFAAVIAVLGSCDGPGSSALVVDEASARRFETASGSDSLDRLRLSHSVPCERAPRRLVVADVVGDGADEVVVQCGSYVTTFSLSGDRLASRELPGAMYYLDVTGDADGDGKDDLIFGSRGANVASILELRGSLDELFEVTVAEAVEAELRVHEIREGAVLFRAYSGLGFSPRLIGTYRPGAAGMEWITQIAPLPLDLAGGANGMIAVSNRGVSRDLDGVRAVPDQEAGAHALLLLDENGNVAGYEALQGDVREGYPSESASAVWIRLADVDGDANDELVVLHERGSDLYQGPSTLEVRELGGETLAMVRGPRASRGTFGVYGEEGPDAAQRIVVIWARTGTVQLFDHGLTVVTEDELPERYVAPRLAGIGDANGDGRAEFLIRAYDRVALLNGNLEIVWERELPGFVEDVWVTQDADGSPAIVALAGNLHVFTEQPGAGTIAVAEPREMDVARPHADSSESTREDRASASLSSALNGYRGSLDPAANALRVVEPGHPLRDYAELRSEILMDSGSEDYYFMLHPADYGGTEGLEQVILDAWRDEVWIWDSRFSGPIRRALPGSGYQRPLNWGDVNGDGTYDIAFATDDPLGYVVLHGDGRSMLERFVTWGFDTLFTTGSSRLSDVLMVQVETGYALHPRGIYGLRSGVGGDPVPARDLARLEFFYPSASKWKSNPGVAYDDRYVLPDYTTSNGATLRTQQGATERDTELNVHVVCDDGSALPPTGPLEGGGKIGILNPVHLAEWGLLYIQTHSHYYPGSAHIYRLSPEAMLETVVTDGPRDHRFLAAGTVTRNGEDLLAVVYREAGVVELYDANFRRAQRISLLGDDELLSGVRLVNLDGDEDTEILFLRGSELSIATLDGEVLWSIEGREGRTRGMWEIRIADYDLDGRPTIVAAIGPDVFRIWYE
ncbi:MAG: hypothetical protein ACOC0O_01875 [Spirochaetota bacterium]